MYPFITCLGYTRHMHKSRRLSPREWVVASMVELTVVSIVLYVAGAIANRSLAFSYLLWNLFLAWSPFIATLMLIRMLRMRQWSSWLMMAVTLVWLLLLPNSFYMISDFIHIQDVVRNNVLYDAVMFTSFIFTAALLGFSSLYMIHAELRKRVSLRVSSTMVGCILFLCSFAIYLGRDLRWNSWDVFINPAGILFDVSDHLIHFWHYGDMFTTTLSFFVLLGSLYIVGWQLGEATR